MNWQQILDNTHPDQVQNAEDAVVATLGPLTRKTTPEQWEAYWVAVANKVMEWKVR